MIIIFRHRSERMLPNPPFSMNWKFRLTTLKTFSTTTNLISNLSLTYQLRRRYRRWSRNQSSQLLTQTIKIRFMKSKKFSEKNSLVDTGNFGFAGKISMTLIILGLHIRICHPNVNSISKTCMREIPTDRNQSKKILFARSS